MRKTSSNYLRARARDPEKRIDRAKPDRATWVEKFANALRIGTQFTGRALEDCVRAELETYPAIPGPNDADWREIDPGAAAQEALSYYTG